MTGALFPRPDLRRLARDVVAELRGAKQGLSREALRDALGLPTHARLVWQATRALEEAGVVLPYYRDPRRRYRLLREPSREEMSAPPREARPDFVPATVVRLEVAVARGPCSRLSTQLRERDGDRWIALVHEIRAPGGPWRSHRAFNVGLGEVADVLEALEAVAE